jgi:hypothetical protein
MRNRKQIFRFRVPLKQKVWFPVVPVPVPQQCVISIERCVRECESVPKFGRGFRSEGGEVWEGAVISCIKTTRDKKKLFYSTMMAYSPHRCSTKMTYSFVPGTRLDRPPIEFMTYGHNRRPFPFLILHKARACLHSLEQLQCWIVKKNLSLQYTYKRAQTTFIVAYTCTDMIV